MAQSQSAIFRVTSPMLNAAAETKGGRAVVRLMENTTGRMRLIKRASGYEADVAAGR